MSKVVSFVAVVYWETYIQSWSRKTLIKMSHTQLLLVNTTDRTKVGRNIPAGQFISQRQLRVTLGYQPIKRMENVDIIKLQLTGLGRTNLKYVLLRCQYLSKSKIQTLKIIFFLKKNVQNNYICWWSFLNSGFFFLSSLLWLVLVLWRRKQIIKSEENKSSSQVHIPEKEL